MKKTTEEFLEASPESNCGNPSCTCTICTCEDSCSGDGCNCDCNCCR